MGSKIGFRKEPKKPNRNEGFWFCFFFKGCGTPESLSLGIVIIASFFFLEREVHERKARDLSRARARRKEGRRSRVLSCEEEAFPSFLSLFFFRKG